MSDLQDAREDGWMARRFIPQIISILIILASGLPLCAQTAQITGEVRDPSGAVVPKANVRAINKATLVERHTKTNESGFYAFPFLDPGKYQIAVEAAGFATTVSEDLTITVDQVLVFNLQLKLGEAQEKITVKANSQVIDSTDAQVSMVVDDRQVSSLPLILRDPYQLILLTAGVNASDNGGAITVNGGRTTNNNFRLDGADNNNAEGGSSVVAINPDMTKEFRVITTGYLPEFGRNNGAVVDVVTKSGTNNLHGDVYEFGRYAVAGARDFFNPEATTGAKNGYTRNDFGGSLSGPIVKDKTFFFGNYEGQRFATTLTNNSFVPTKQFVSGKFTFNGTDPVTGAPFSTPIDVSTPNSPNNVFHLPLDPIVQKIFSKYPAPQKLSGDGIDGQFFFPSSDIDVANNYTIKMDQNFSSTEILSARYVANQGTSTNPLHTDFLPGLGTFPSASLTQFFATHLTSFFDNSKWLNDLSFSLSRINANSKCGSQQAIDSVRPTDPIGNGTNFSWPGVIASWQCPGPFDQLTSVYTISDQATRVLGRHIIKFGVEFADLLSNSSTNFFARTSVSFNNFSASGFNPGAAALQTGTPADANFTLQDSVWALFGEANSQTQGQFFNPAGKRLPTDEVKMREKDFATFWQDTFKVWPNFTLNYGLRWEFNGSPSEADNLLSNVPLGVLSGPPPIKFQNTPVLYQRDWLNVQPRVGFAWDPFKNGKTSVRAGYGVFRDHTFFAVTDIGRMNPPFTETTSAIIFSPVPTATQGFTGTAISNLPVPATLTPTATVPQGAAFFAITFDPNFHLPYSQNWNVGVQRQLPGNIDVDVNYVGIQGKRLLNGIDGNAPNPTLVAQLRAFCHQPNAFNCIDTPTVSSVQGFNLYFGKEFGLLPFDAVQNNAIFHAQVVQAEANSTYNALQTTVTKRFSHGIFIQGAYTWSHEIDDAGGDFSPSINNALVPANSFRLKLERGNGAQDIRHALSLNYTVELPFGAGKPRLNKRFVGKALEGWSVSGITHISGGFPYDIFTFVDTDGNGGELTRPNYNPNAKPVPVPSANIPSARTLTGPNPGLFSVPAFGGPGNLPRNFFRVPGVNNWDMVLTKNTRISERLALEFRGEVFNVFNRVQFSPPSDFIDFPTTISQSFSEVQRPDGTTGARQIQLALKLKF
jgi:Carboxypeptidase regulatory-like domain